MWTYFFLTSMPFAHFVNERKIIYENTHWSFLYQWKAETVLFLMTIRLYRVVRCNFEKNPFKDWYFFTFLRPFIERDARLQLAIKRRIIHQIHLTLFRLKALDVRNIWYFIENVPIFAFWMWKWGSNVCDKFWFQRSYIFHPNFFIPDFILKYFQN